MNALAPSPAPSPKVRPADRGRLQHYLERLAAGDEATVACWATLTHPDYGMRKFRERADRPLCRKSLLARIDRLFKLGAPEVLARAADEARAVLAQHAAETTATVLDIARGRFEKTRDGAASARVQREAACWALECLGVAPPRGGNGSAVAAVRVDVVAAGSAEHQRVLSAARRVLDGQPHVVRLLENDPPPPEPVDINAAHGEQPPAIEDGAAGAEPPATDEVQP
jgi:hypothetical protein